MARILALALRVRRQPEPAAGPPPRRLIFNLSGRDPRQTSEDAEAGRNYYGKWICGPFEGMASTIQAHFRCVRAGDRLDAAKGILAPAFEPDTPERFHQRLKVKARIA